MLIALYVGMAGPVPAADAQATIEMPVRVYSLTSDGIAIGELARSVVDRAFAEAGIRVSWRICSAPGRPCASPPGPSEFLVRLVRKTEALDTHSCGVVFKTAAIDAVQHVTVVDPCVRRAASQLRWPDWLLMGYVLTHELGHALLSTGHSNQGVMQPSPPAVPWLQAHAHARFRRDELDALRTRLTARSP